MPQMVPRHNWSPGPFVEVFVVMDGPHGPSMAATDDLPCCKWSPQVFHCPTRHKWNGYTKL